MVVGVATAHETSAPCSAAEPRRGDSDSCVGDARDGGGEVGRTVGLARHLITSGGEAIPSSLALPQGWGTGHGEGREVTGVSRSRVPSIRVLLMGAGLLRPTLSAGLRLEGFEVVAECRRAPSAPVKVGLLQFEVLVAEEGVGGAASGAIELALLLRRRQPNLGVVVLSDVADPRLVGQSHEELPLGCRWLVKREVEHLEVLTDAIVQVAQAPMAECSGGVPRLPLTDAQIEVWRLLASGATNQQIAKARGVSVKAVEQAVHRLTKRLGLQGADRHPRVQLARAFYELA